MKEKTRIIFYADMLKIEEHFSDLQLDNFHFDQYDFVQETDQLIRQLSDNQPKVLFFISKKMEVTQRLLVKKISRDYPNTPVVLCSDRQFALDAWNFDLLYFLSFPILQSNIDNALRKYLRQLNKNKEAMIRIKYNGGFYTIAPSNVLYCKGSGNYTNIYLKSGKNLLVTAQLQKINNMLAGSRGIERVGKSFIINLDNIQEIGSGEIRFFSEQGQRLKISDNYIKRIKKLLLGIQN